MSELTMDKLIKSMKCIEDIPSVAIFFSKHITGMYRGRHVNKMLGCGENEAGILASECMREILEKHYSFREVDRKDLKIFIPDLPIQMYRDEEGNLQMKGTV